MALILGWEKNQSYIWKGHSKKLLIKSFGLSEECFSRVWMFKSHPDALLAETLFMLVTNKNNLTLSIVSLWAQQFRKIFNGDVFTQTYNQTNLIYILKDILPLDKCLNLRNSVYRPVGSAGRDNTYSKYVLSLVQVCKAKCLQPL